MTTNTAIQEFDGSPTTVLTGAGSALATGNFSVSGSTATVTEIDFQATGDKWPLARAVFKGQWATITSIVGKTLDLYLVPTDVTGTNGQDSEMPTSTVANGGQFVGSFVVSTGVANTDMYLELAGAIISLIGRKSAKFALYNNTGQSVSTGWTVTIEGVSLTPATS